MKCNTSPPLIDQRVGFPPGDEEGRSFADRGFFPVLIPRDPLAGENEDLVLPGFKYSIFMAIAINFRWPLYFGLARDLDDLVIERPCLGIVQNGGVLDQSQIINSLKEGNITRALNGEHVGTIIRKSREDHRICKSFLSSAKTPYEVSHFLQELRFADYSQEGVSTPPTLHKTRGL